MLQVIKAPDPRLKIKTKLVKKITPSLLSTIKEMVKLTKTFKEPVGVGLASTQVGSEESFFVARLDESAKRAKDGKKFTSFINPKILSCGKRTKKYFEGCLSIPNTWGEVKRFTNIKVSYQNQTGKALSKQLKGVLAWIFQHEIDHLSGILFTERVLQQKGKFYKYRGKDKYGTEVFEEMTI